MRFLQITDRFTDEPALVNIDNISTITVAHNSSETLIRFKRGGYIVARQRMDEVTRRLEKAGVEVFGP